MEGRRRRLRVLEGDWNVFETSLGETLERGKGGTRFAEVEAGGEEIEGEEVSGGREVGRLLAPFLLRSFSSFGRAE